MRSVSTENMWNARRARRIAEEMRIEQRAHRHSATRIVVETVLVTIGTSGSLLAAFAYFVNR